jgi:hypothetical protein
MATPTISTTVPVNVITKYNVPNVVREDLSDVIELIAQEDTPFTSNIGRSKADSTYSEWNVDALAPANEDNAAAEGDEAVPEVRPATSKMGNYSQIMRKIPGVSGTLQAINVVGGQKQLARELMKAGRELKLDREKRFVGVRAAVPGSDTSTQGGNSTARETAGFGAWIRTNVSRGTGAPVGANPTLSSGTQGYPDNPPVDAGTLRTFTETMLKTAMATAWAAGGKPKMLMLGGALKGTASTFPGIAPNRINNTSGPVSIIGTADVYLSDFGKLSIVPNPFMRARDAWLIDPDQAEMRTLRPVQTVELAKTGDSEKRLMLWEGMLKVNNEKAHAAIADLQP